MKKFTFLALISIFVLSASSLLAQDNQTTGKMTVSADSKQVVISPEKFQDYASENVGKEIEIQGMVVHVCRHGGKKMFIVGEDPEMRVKIDASEEVSVFDPELEGSTVFVKGIIQPIAEEPVPEAEKATQDADHTNHYHKPQYAISCMKYKVLDE
jgi:hypothetical protein